MRCSCSIFHSNKTNNHQISIKSRHFVFCKVYFFYHLSKLWLTVWWLILEVPSLFNHRSMFIAAVVDSVDWFHDQCCQAFLAQHVRLGVLKHGAGGLICVERGSVTSAQLHAMYCACRRTERPSLNGSRLKRLDLRIKTVFHPCSLAEPQTLPLTTENDLFLPSLRLVEKKNISF